MTIRQYLESESLTAAAFAAKVGVDPGTMSRWLSGHSQPKGGHLLRIIEASDRKITIEAVVGPRKRKRSAA